MAAPEAGTAGARRPLEAALADFLARLQAGGHRGLASLTLPLDDAMVPGVPQAGRYRYLAWPAEGRRLLGLGRAARSRARGPGRFAALSDFLAACRAGWRIEDPAGLGTPPKAFVGYAFDAAPAPLTGPELLPNAELVVPRLLIEQTPDAIAATFTLDTTRADDPAAVLAGWTAALNDAFQPPPAGPPPRLVHIGARPDDAAWKARVGRAVRDIDAGRLEKVVLTRQLRARAARGELQAARILPRLAGRHPECTLFAVAGDEVTAVGATPERLVSLAGGRVRCDALAGTLPLDGASLLDSAKDRHEHRLVVDAVRGALAPACAGVRAPERPELLRLSALQHLRTPITARARPGTTLLDLVARLHPTPAVGGSPHRLAMDWLAREGEQRVGWYTGGVGWIAPDGDGEVSVVLRCAALGGSQAVLSAGAGIVAGSDPERELAETDLKLTTMLDALEDA